MIMMDHIEQQPERRQALTGQHHRKVQFAPPR